MPDNHAMGPHKIRIEALVTGFNAGSAQHRELLRSYAKGIIEATSLYLPYDLDEVTVHLPDYDVNQHVKEVSGFIFGSTSKARLATCHEDLQKVTIRALELSETDFSVVSAYRSPTEQHALWLQGRDPDTEEIINQDEVVTYLNGIDKLSLHNYSPSEAIDLAPFVPGQGLIWDNDILWSQVAEAMIEAAKELDVALEWGYAMWGWDKPHFQLKNGG